MNKSTKKILCRSVFVTNNGLSDHIGVAQILPYLEGLARKGHRIFCISMENPSHAEAYDKQVQPRLLDAGIDHYPIRRSERALIRKLERPFTPYRLRAKIRDVAIQNNASLIHCRSYMPLGPTLSVAKSINLPFIFDMRGFWIDERTESGIWSQKKLKWNPVIKYFRHLESKAIQKSSAIITLTRDAKDAIRANTNYRGARVEIVPCSVNLNLFKPHPEQRISQRDRLNLASNDIVIGYLGSDGPLYRIDILYQLAMRLKMCNAPVRILFLGNHRTEDHVARANKMGLDLKSNDIRCVEAPHHEIPKILSAADFGASFRIPTFSSLGASPTKVGEYLACGLPVISNAGIGDINNIIQNGKSGYILQNFGESEINEAARRIAEGNFDSTGSIRGAAQPLFDIERAIFCYDELYNAIMKDYRATGND